jgi:hypothetical protein
MRARVLQRFGLVATAGGGERPCGWLLARKLAGPASLRPREGNKEQRCGAQKHPIFGGR